MSVENWKNVEGEVNKKEADLRAGRLNSRAIDLPPELQAYITETIPNDSELSVEEAALADLRLENVRKAARAFHEFDKKSKQLQNDKLEFEKRFIVTSGKNRPAQVIEAMRKIDEEILSAETAVAELMQSNPEAYVVRHALELRSYREQLKSNDFVLTPYAEKKIEELENNYYSIDKVPFLNGETGSGKSSLAKYFCEKTLDAGPERIAGAKGIDETKIFGKVDLTSDEKGPQAVFIKGPLYKAMEEGRPLIIEEVNAIPPEILKSLNDIIVNAKKGEEVPVVGDPKGSTVKAKPGFGVIMTGNLNRNPKAIDRYKGLFELSADFVNRIRPIDYDYLPQSTEGNFREEAGKDNELYTLMVAMVMNDKGDVNAPEGVFDDLWRLAKFTRKIQEVYSGQRDGKLFSTNGGLGVPVTATSSVISMRDVKQVIESWKRDNFKNELDHYIYKELIAPLTNVMDTKFFVQQLQADGFLSNESWKGTIAKAGTFDSAVHAPENKGKEIEFVTVRGVIENVYGKAPERKEFPLGLEVKKKAEDEARRVNTIVGEFTRDNENYPGLIQKLKKQGEHDFSFLDKSVDEAKSYAKKLEEAEVEFRGLDPLDGSKEAKASTKKLQKLIEEGNQLTLVKLKESDEAFDRKYHVQSLVARIAMERELFDDIDRTYTPEFQIDEKFKESHQQILDAVSKAEEALGDRNGESVTLDEIATERRVLNFQIITGNVEGGKRASSAKLKEIDGRLDEFLKGVRVFNDKEFARWPDHFNVSFDQLYPNLPSPIITVGADADMIFNIDKLNEDKVERAKNGDILPHHMEEIVKKTKIEMDDRVQEVFKNAKVLFKNQEVVQLQRFYEKSFYGRGGNSMGEFTVDVDSISRQLSGFIYTEPWMILGFIYREERWMSDDRNHLADLKELFKKPVIFCTKESDGTDILIKVGRTGEYNWQISVVKDTRVATDQFIAPKIVNPPITRRK